VGWSQRELEYAYGRGGAFAADQFRRQLANEDFQSRGVSLGDERDELCGKPEGEQVVAAHGARGPERFRRVRPHDQRGRHFKRKPIALAERQSLVLLQQRADGLR
jgi:hypothetical protein